jgi:DNA-binding MarR family transcriptional regulator
MQRRRPRASASQRTPSAEKQDAITSPLSGSAAFLVRLAQLRGFDEFHRNFAGLGVTPAGFSVLALIAANPNIRPGAIAEELRVKPSNVAALVNALVAAGLVERSADEAELRANCLRLTEAGAKAWSEMYQIHLATDERFTAPLSDSEKQMLVRLLRKLAYR